nr:G protein-regulated inducer of neurite outgrowth 1-like [Penaeus vannamei]
MTVILPANDLDDLSCSPQGAGLAVSGRRASAASPSPPRPARAEREIRATPFKRSRSRVYYASQTSDNWPGDGGAGKDKAVRRNISLSPTRGSSSSAANAVVTPVAKTTPAAKSGSASRSSSRSAPASRAGSARRAGHKEPAILEVSSSGEEVGEGEGEGEASSPLGSFRGSLRGSPSHRSQDSGYSDSGESNAHNDSDGSPATPPNVKHITRVYFGDSHDPARLYNDKIVCSPELKAGKVSAPSGSPASLASEASSASSGSSPGERRAAPLEELAEELEHKAWRPRRLRRPTHGRRQEEEHERGLLLGLGRQQAALAEEQQLDCALGASARRSSPPRAPKGPEALVCGGPAAATATPTAGGSEAAQAAAVACSAAHTRLAKHQHQRPAVERSRGRDLLARRPRRPRAGVAGGGRLRHTPRGPSTPLRRPPHARPTRPAPARITPGASKYIRLPSPRR